MAAFKRFKTKSLSMEKVPTDKSKIKYTISFTGECDFNTNLATDYSDFNYRLKNGPNHEEFKHAFYEYIAELVFSRAEIFDKANFVSVECSTEVETAFKDAKDLYLEELSKEKLKQLQEAEEKVAKLKASLGK